MALFEGRDGAFTCSSSALVSAVQWLVNNTLLGDLDLGNLTTEIETFSVGGTLTFLAIPLSFNHTTVQCRVTFPDRNVMQSNIATLLVQGI